MTKAERFKATITSWNYGKLLAIIAETKAEAKKVGSTIEITPSVVQKKLFTTVVHLEAIGDAHRVNAFKASAIKLSLIHH